MESRSDDTILYEVKPGDSLSAIAAQFGYVTPTQLARINRLSLIGCGLPPVFPGQRLIIPTLNRDSLDPLKVRRAPGTALRVRASSHIQAVKHSAESDFTVHHNFYSATHRTHSESANVDEENDQQFVKVPVQRMFPDGNVVDGVLLITPDALCFDAAQLALAQKRAYLTQHPSISSSENSPQHKATTSDPSKASVTNTLSDSADITTTIPKELLDLGLCLPLSALSSMTTLKTLVQHRPENACDSTASPTHQYHSSELNDAVHNSTKGSENSSLCARDHGGITEDFVTPASNTQPEIQDEQLRENVARSVMHDKTNDLSGHLGSVSPVENSCSSPINGSRIEHEDDNNVLILEADDALFLRLILMREVGDSPLEHTFKVPKDRIAEVFAFLLRAGVGATNDKRRTSHTSSSCSHPVGDEHDKILAHRSMVEEALACMESATPLPNIYNGTSAILSDEMLEDLGANLPTHWIGSNLRLIYKTEQDGYSLHTLYRKAHDVTGGVLLIIRDTSGTVFGAIMSETMHCSQHFYGTGETCVFHWSPHFKRYDWTKKNYYFMRGSSASFQIGGQSGRNAIWFDEALKYGRSEPTDTFDNPVLSGRLAEFQFTSLSNPDNLSSVDQKTEHPVSGPDITTASPTHSAASVEVDSIPFLIDCLELWELVS